MQHHQPTLACLLASIKDDAAAVRRPEAINFYCFAYMLCRNARNPDEPKKTWP
jgi:hypothetical protein